jgi:hypothetical protein
MHGIQFNSILIQFKLHCNVIYISITYRNELYFSFEKHLENFLDPQKYLLFSCFFDVFSLVQKGRFIACYTLHHSLLPFDQNSFISKLYVMSLTYGHVLFN